MHVRLGLKLGVSSSRSRVRRPHLTGVANDTRHGSVDNDVGRDVKIGNTLVRVDHGETRTRSVDGIDGSKNFRLWKKY